MAHMTLSELYERDPEVAAIIERQLEVESAEYKTLLADGRRRWGNDYRIVAFSPECVDPAYRGILPEGWTPSHLRR